MARLAILTAIGAVLLLLGSVLPTGRLALIAVSSLPVCVTLMMYGLKWALAVFLLTALLGTLLFERIHSRAAGWACKLALYTAAFVLYWTLARALFTFTGGELAWYVLYPLGAAVFVLYDLAYSSVIRFYLVKIARYFQ